MVTKTKSETQWDGIAALLNTDPADEHAWTLRFLELGVDFDLIETTDANEVHLVPNQAAAFMRDLRVLVRALSTRHGLRHAERIVQQHEPRVSRRPQRPSRTGRGTSDDFFKALEAQGWLQSSKRLLVGGRQFITKGTFGVSTIRTDEGDPLDPICRLARQDVLNTGRAGPIRICHSRRCKRFFVWHGFFVGRGRPGLFCPSHIKSRNRPSRPDEMFASRARKRARDEGPHAVRRAIEKLKRRCGIPPSRKRKRLAILHDLL